MDISGKRVISVTLSESDWQAFLDIQPQPVAWLKAKIREHLEQHTSAEPPSAEKGQISV